MARNRWLRKWLAVAALGLAAFGWSVAPLAAQCAMCFVSAGGAGSRGIHALRIGILVLAIPTVTILGGIVFYAFRYRNSAPNPCQDSRVPPSGDAMIAFSASRETEGASSRI